MTVNQKGFTLIELIISLVIIGILASVAIPGYRGYATGARRGAAQAELVTLANKMEKSYALNNNTYDGLADGNGIPLPSLYKAPAAVSEYYTIKIHTATANAFTLWAEPTAKMGGDDCGTFTLTDTNVRGAARDGCW